MIVLFTDYGAADPYVGQVKAVFAQQAPQVALVDLLHAAPMFNAAAGAHLLAALSAGFAPGSVFFAVVDPGVGSLREALVWLADGKWFVGPDNGLLAVVAARAKQTQCWRIVWRPTPLSDSFHGRDLFAPIAASIAAGRFPTERLEPHAPELPLDAGADLAQIIYIDHYGNGFTGIRAQGVPRTALLSVAGRRLQYARTFSAAVAGEAFWYENSIGLVEVALAAGSAAQGLGLRVGDEVSWQQ